MLMVSRSSKGQLGKVSLPLGDLSGLAQGATLNLPGIVSWRYMTAARQVGSSDCKFHFDGHMCKMKGVSDMDSVWRAGFPSLDVASDSNKDKHWA